MIRVSPIQRLLGLAVPWPDPFDLLGVAPEACDEQAVRDALSRRLERLSRHPEAMSHEADEVRLALHAAAAQLSDPAMRAKLAEERARRAEGRASGVAASKGSQTPGFEELAVRVLGRCGGWNRDSRRWLASLAHAYGLDDAGLTATLRRIARNGASVDRMAPRVAAAPTSSLRSAPSRGAERAPSARAERAVAEANAAAESSEEDDRQSEGAPLRIVRPITIAGLALMLLAALTWWPLSSPRSAPEPPPVPSRGGESASQRAEGRGSSLPAEEGSSAPAAEVDETEASRARRPGEIVATLERAVAIFDDRPGDAAWRFEEAVSSLSRTWPRFEPGALREAHRLVVAFMHRAIPQAGSGRRALEAVGAGAETLAESRSTPGAEEALASIWSSGMLARLSQERDLAGESVSRIESRLAEAVTGGAGDGFVSTAAAAAEVVSERLARSTARSGSSETTVDLWEQWRGAVDALASYKAFAGEGSSDGDRRVGDWRDRLALRGVERLLSLGPGPARNPDAHTALVDLLASLRWRSDEDGGNPPAWSATLGWFDDPRIDSADLAVVTEWLVGRSRAPGMSLRMALDRNADPERRSKMRHRYAQAWGVKAAPAQGGLASAWRRSAREALQEAETPEGSVVQRLAQTATLARLNEAASLRWRRRKQRAARIAMSPEAAAQRALRQADGPEQSVAQAGGNNDGEWALRFLSAQGDQERQSRLLVELGRRSSRLGRIDAGALSQTALRGVPMAVRARAQRVIRRRADEAAVINGLLDALPQAPQTETISALVEDVSEERLSSVERSEWRIEARRALVEKLLEMLAGSDELDAVDRLSSVIGSAYAGRAGRDSRPSNDEQARASASRRAESVDGSASPMQTADRLWRQWRAEAERYSLNRQSWASLTSLERRLRGRRRLAQGPIETFAAVQISVAEVMGAVIAAEHPSRAPMIRTVLERMARSRRSATHITQQMRAAERAMLNLWMIRFGEESVESSASASAEPESAPAEDGAGADGASEARPLPEQAPFDVEARLRALEPGEPMAYFRLAEEVGYEVPGRRAKELARRLYVLAFELDRAGEGSGRLGASVCLALADLADRTDRRRWLLALAEILDPDRRSDPPQTEMTMRPSRETRFALAEALGLYRAGEYRRAQQRLEEDGAGRLLERYGQMLTGGAVEIRHELGTEPVCRECGNKRISRDRSDPDRDHRLCYTCEGTPGPDLSDRMLLEQLRVESILLSDSSASWSAELLLNRGKPLRDLNPDELASRMEVDADKTVWRDGRWATHGGTNSGQ